MQLDRGARGASRDVLTDVLGALALAGSVVFVLAAFVLLALPGVRPAPSTARSVVHAPARAVECVAPGGRAHRHVLAAPEATQPFSDVADRELDEEADHDLAPQPRTNIAYVADPTSLSLPAATDESPASLVRLLATPIRGPPRA